jgi:CO/xanthine dehydrogenase FAD-binding subunit
MRACVSSCEVCSPRTLAEALELLAGAPNVWQPMAGATDLMVALAAGKLPARRFMNMWQLNELRGIRMEKDVVTLGALTTYSDVLHHPELRSAFPLLAAAAAETGGIATQNRGTLGGNIMNASPAADTPPALLVYEAEVELTSLGGSRWLPYCGFHTGYRQTMLAPGELLTRIRLPRLSPLTRSQFRKVGPRRAQAISKVCFAAVCWPEKENIRIAYGSMAPVPLRCFKTEASIIRGDDPALSLRAELAPITDARSTAAYRLRVAQNLLAEFLHHAG